MRIIDFIFFCTFITLLAGCSGNIDDPAKAFAGQSAKQIYMGGQKELKDKDYKKAIKHFEAIGALYPFSEYNEPALLNTVYAYYTEDDPNSAIAAADHYIRLYPSSKDVDYAYYLRGVARYQQNRNYMDKLLNADISQRDLNSLKQAFADFSQLVQLFPNSPYAADARQRMIYLRNLFAGRQLRIAQYYFDKSAYIGAVNRAASIVKHYQETPSVVPALELMYKAYTALNMQEEAKKVQEILTMNKANLPKIAPEKQAWYKQFLSLKTEETED